VLAYLLAHADVAHDLLVDVVRALAPGTHTIAAIAALPAFGREESVGPLETALRHGTEAVRLAAAEGLARHPSARARHVLARAAGDADPAIRDLARSVLTDLESKPGDQS
jgi:HEAT repeat protein